MIDYENDGSGRKDSLVLPRQDSQDSDMMPHRNSLLLSKSLKTNSYESDRNSAHPSSAMSDETAVRANGGGASMPPALTATISIPESEAPSGRHVRFYDGEAPKSPTGGGLRRSILKSTLTPEEREEIRKQKEKRAALITGMKEGTIMWKYSSESKCEKRIFTISKDESELIWKHCGKISSLKTSRIPFASVKNLVYGPRTPGFKSFDWKLGKPWLCFSVVCDGRNVDIECPDLDSFNLWYFGIQQLAPLSHKFLSARQVHWRRALFKTAQMSLVCEMPLEDVWHELVRLSRAPAGTEPSSAMMKDKLEELQNDSSPHVLLERKSNDSGVERKSTD
jgi:hypothetical protein